MKMTNVLIINKSKKINREYLDMVRKIVLVINDDFTNALLITDKINKYVENNTDGMIKNIISSADIDNDIVFVLINTIYFKASWKNKFNVNNTTKMKFHKTESDMIDMMHQINYFDYYENKAIQMIEMPYDEKNYVMGIILPRMYLEQTNLDYSINNIPNFTAPEINEFINNKQFKRIDLYIPKFIHRKNLKLVPILKKMGVTDLFDKNAELDLMANGLYLSKIIHEAVVIVDEVGTEAAATTVIVDNAMMTAPRKEEKPILFRADHSFIYYIRHIPSNMFLFFGDYQGN
jgi:serpin B/serpin B11/12